MRKTLLSRTTPAIGMTLLLFAILVMGISGAWADVRVMPAYVGQLGLSDNSTPAWTYQSKYISIATGETVEYTFTNYMKSTTTDYFDGWICEGTDGTNYFDVRMDAGWWVAPSETSAYSIAYSGDAYNTKYTSISDYITDMTGATVNLKVTRASDDSKITVKQTVTTAKSQTYSGTFTVTGIVASSSIKLRLVAEGAHQVISKLVKTDASGNESTYENYTSYITNPDFETDAAETITPTGWTITGDDATGGTNSQDKTGWVESSDWISGTKLYYSGWNAKTLSQTLSNLPAGKYTLYAQAGSWNTGNKCWLTVNGVNSTDFTVEGSIVDLSQDFTINKASNVTIGSGASWGRRIDNFTLVRTGDVYHYTVNAKVDDTEIENLAAGYYAEGGEAVTVVYPQYILKDGVMYTATKGSSDWYRTTFTPDKDNYTINITYTNANIADVVYYTEAENLEGANVATNTDRASNGQMGYSSTAINAVTLPVGNYQIYARGVNGNSTTRTCSFKVGETEVFAFSIVNGTNVTGNSDVFTLTEESTLTFTCEGSNASGCDWFYVVKVPNRYTWTVQSSIGTTIASGTDYDGTTINYTYPKNINKDGTLYEADKASSDKWYGGSFTLDENNNTVTVNYTGKNINNVLYCIEAESISGVTTSDKNANRASNGLIAYTNTDGTDNYKEVMTLPAGTYTIYAHGLNGNQNSRTCNFKVGDNVVYAFSITNGTSIDGTSEEFTITEAATLSVSCEGSSLSGLDCFYITGTSNNTIIGATDKSTPYRGAKGENIVLKKGESCTVKFQNHGTSGESYYNWLLDITSNNTLVGTLRADWYLNVGAEGQTTNGTFTDPYKASPNGGSSTGSVNWDTFKSAMQDATVELTLAYSYEGKFTVKGTATSGQNIFYYNYSISNYTPAGGSETALGDNVTLNLSVEKAWLEVLSQSTRYTVTYHNGDHGTAPADISTSYLSNPLPIINADGYTAFWFTDENLTTAAVAGTSISANTTLYAKWIEGNATASGTCGSSLYWTYNAGDGKLTIYGSGDMTNFANETDIPWYSYMSSITSASLPEGLTHIGERTFQECKNLSSVTIPSTVTSIGARAFFDCVGVISIDIPDDVESIGDYAFMLVPNITYNTSKMKATGKKWGAEYVNKYVDGYLLFDEETHETLLRCQRTATGEISIPSTVTSIKSWACSNCSGITSITIPSSVSSIELSAFSGNTNLTSITSLATTPPTLTGYIYDFGNGVNVNIYVPAGSVDAYKKITYWYPSQNSVNITEIASSNALTLAATDGTNYWATFSDADNVTFWPAADATVKKASVSGNTLTLTDLDKGTATIAGYSVEGYFVPKNTGVLIKSLSGQKVTYYTTDKTVAALSDNMLYAASVAKSDSYDGKYYMLAYETYDATEGGTKLGFYYGAADGKKFDSRAGSAYLAVPTSSGAKISGFAFDGDTATGITDVNTDTNSNAGVKKVFRNGHLVILRDNKIFSATGAEIK